MPKFAVNFSDAQDTIPPGIYPAVIDSVEMRTKKSDPDSHYLNWQFTLDDDKYTGRKVWMITSLGERSHWVIAKTFKTLGVLKDGQELVLDIDDESNVLLEPDVIGLSCWVKIETEIYNGQERSRVSVVPDPDPASLEKIFPI